MTRAGETGGAYRVLVGRPEGNRPLLDLDVEVKVSHYKLGKAHRVPGSSGSQHFKTIGT